jgi:hypothetical protein
VNVIAAVLAGSVNEALAREVVKILGAAALPALEATFAKTTGEDQGDRREHRGGERERLVKLLAAIGAKHGAFDLLARAAVSGPRAARIEALKALSLHDDLAAAAAATRQALTDPDPEIQAWARSLAESASRGRS